MSKAQKPYQGGSTSLADFKQLALLGEGAYSAVYKVLRLADREIYALKKVKLPSLSDKEKQNALNEVRLLASIHHESIIAYKEAFFDDKTRCLCIVTEYADSGDLFQAITKCQKSRSHIPEADVWRYIHGMCHGLKALHDMRILHRDLKCANVFLNSQNGEVVAKLGDFNVSKVAKRGLCMTQTGTPYYASPEVWRDMPYDAKSDMWSMGCVLYEMVALRPPFRAEDMEGLYRKVLRGQYPRIPPHYSHDLSEVIGVLLQVNPRHRPSIDQLLTMPVMKRHSSDSQPEYRANDLLSTIKLPKNAIDLSTCLPKPQYDLDFGSFDEVEQNMVLQSPQPQENPGDVAGGTRARRALPTIPQNRGMVGQASMPSIPPPPGSVVDDRSSVDDRPSAETYKDSLDAYLSPQPPQENISRVGAATMDVPRRAPPPSDSRDSLDDYLQHSRPQPTQDRAGPAPQPSQQPPRRQHVPTAAEEAEQLIAAPAHRARDLRNLARHDHRDNHPKNHPQAHPQADYGGGRADYRRVAPQPQYNAYPGLPAPVPRYGGDYGEDPRVRASPAPSSQHGRAPSYGASGQYRHPRGENRRSMASYARPSYALGSAAAQPPQPVARQQSGGGGGLRLPRIFTKG